MRAPSQIMFPAMFPMRFPTTFPIAVRWGIRASVGSHRVTRVEPPRRRPWRLVHGIAHSARPPGSPRASRHQPVRRRSHSVRGQHGRVRPASNPDDLPAVPSALWSRPADWPGGSTRPVVRRRPVAAGFGTYRGWTRPAPARLGSPRCRSAGRSARLVVPQGTGQRGGVRSTSAPRAHAPVGACHAT